MMIVSKILSEGFDQLEHICKKMQKISYYKNHIWHMTGSEYI